jgi:hypothetical protein
VVPSWWESSAAAAGSSTGLPCVTSDDGGLRKSTGVWYDIKKALFLCLLPILIIIIIIIIWYLRHGVAELLGVLRVVAGGGD